MQSLTYSCFVFNQHNFLLSAPT